MISERVIVLAVLVLSVFINYLITVRYYPMQQTTPRPYLKSSLARYIYDRIINEDQLKEQDKQQWYQVNLENVSPNVRSKFVQLECDEETEKFLENCYEKSDWLFTQLWHSVAKSVLGWFMTQTSLNGFLGRGSMFVLSRHQFSRLAPVTGAGRLLDIGAGDGAVTDRFAHFFDNVHVTEMSSVMQRCLISKGYQLEDIEWYKSGMKYNMISLLNVLDRCGNPKAMLTHIRESLLPQGRLLLAVVLPFSSYVEYGKVEESLDINGESWEEQLSSIVEDILEPGGFKLVSWSKVPYLCEGDLNQPFYLLSDAVLVLEPS